MLELHFPLPMGKVRELLAYYDRELAKVGTLMNW